MTADAEDRQHNGLRRRQDAGHDAPAAPQTGRAPGPAEPVADPRPNKLACGECGREIPRDEAVVAEGQDYVLYFCSPDCQAAWRAGQDEEALVREHEHKRKP
jgi:hypothetical protein